MEQCQNCPHAHKHWENGEYVIYCDAVGDFFIKIPDCFECEKDGVE